MIIINISKDFTETPGGRFIKDGSYSGEEFRNEILKPKYLEAKNSNQKLCVELDGCLGYPTSFLDESFGGLMREIKDEHLIENIELISEEQPSLIAFIKDCIKNGTRK